MSAMESSWAAYSRQTMTHCSLTVKDRKYGQDLLKIGWCNQLYLQDLCNHVLMGLSIIYIRLNTT